jgi:ATP-dependent Lon protease
MTPLTVEQEIKVPDALPLLPLRDAVVLPFAISTLVVGQERSIRSVEEAMRRDRLLALFLRNETQTEPRTAADLKRAGTVALVHQLLRGAEKTIRILVQGIDRARLLDVVQVDPHLVARVELVPERPVVGVPIEALAHTVRDIFRRVVALSPLLPDELAESVGGVEDARQLAYLVASTPPFTTAVRQELLELDALDARLKRIVEYLQHELAVRELERKITHDTREEMSKAQRQFVLRQQLETIKKELGEANGDPDREETQELRRRFEATSLPEEVRKEVERELGRLERLPGAALEHGIIRTFLETMLDLPWGKFTGGEISVARARAVLDEDHYDLDKVKERILEYLAVRRLKSERHAARSERPLSETETDVVAHEPILCFVGPPGVGKTSLGQSIARAMGRKFARMSLGGIHDEAEIRGHRRTYVGALPGRIIQTLRKAEAQDPVFMLDEVDKLGVGFQGDPAAALLEVLDPAQNHAFVDTYLGVPFDLSRVLFICTANEIDTIPPALRDRMEVLGLPGYTEEEKLAIARRYLVPKLLEGHGLDARDLEIEDDAIRRVIREYTREAGVRNVERALASVIRKIARRIAEGERGPIRVTADQAASLLGPRKFFDEVVERADRPGVATGLAWTPAGGDLLFVEATMMPASDERFVLTGMLGDVMRESAQAALSYVRSNATQLGIGPGVFDKKIVHVHVPAGAIPKDGPSAGITIVVALVSLATGRIVRSDVALTGETTLRGKVLPVGGIKEKVLAARRAGIETVVLPERNRGDLEDVPAEVRAQLHFEFVSSVDDAIREALGPLVSAPEVKKAA